MPDREVKQNILPSHPAVDFKEHGIIAALEAIKQLNASTFSFVELANQISARTMAALKVQCIALWLTDTLSKSLSLQSYSCVDHIEILHKNFYYSLEKPSLLADCFHKNKTILQKKYTLAENDPRETVLPKNLVAVLLPLGTQTKSIGVIEIITTSDESIDKTDLESLELLASQISLLLSNRRKTDQLTSQFLLSKNLYEITSKINHAKDSESILQITVEELCSSLHLPAASMHVNMAATDAKSPSTSEHNA